MAEIRMSFLEKTLFTIRCPNEKCGAEIQLDRGYPLDEDDAKNYDGIGIIPDHWHERNDPTNHAAGIWIAAGDSLGNAFESRVIYIQRRCKLSGSKFWLRRKEDR